MSKIIIINLGTEEGLQYKNNESINDILEKGFKIVFIGKDQNLPLINNRSISYKNSANIIELNYNTIFGYCPAVYMSIYKNCGANPNYPSTIIDCVEKIFFYENNFEYTYLTFNDSNDTKYNTLLNEFFSKNAITPKKFNDIATLERELLSIVNTPNNNFKKILFKDTIPEFSIYDDILFSDRVGTIEGYSIFDKLAPFNENMDELIQLLRNDKFLLCGISSGDHQEGFISKNFLRKLKEYGFSNENILAFSQYHMASIIKNYRKIQSDKVIMGFGDSTKLECINQFLHFLENSKKLPNNLYAIGDHPLDDIPILKLIHSKGGEVGFISPYKDKDAIIKAISKFYLDFYHILGESDDQLYHTQKYYSAIQNIDENWEWLKNSIYDESKTFMKKIHK